MLHAIQDKEPLEMERTSISLMMHLELLLELILERSLILELYLLKILVKSEIPMLMEKMKSLNLADQLNLTQ
jgi:hypothetical protein